MKPARTGLLGAITLWALSGCAVLGGHVNVDPVAVSAEKPGNVSLYVSVSQHGSGVLGLQKADFRVYENGEKLDSDAIKLTLLPSAATTARRAVVLVDMSKLLKADERKSLTEALRPFLTRLRQREAVSLYAFDGSEKAHLVQEYAHDEHAAADEKDTSMDRLLYFSRRNAPSSLYSAVVDGAQKLSTSLANDGQAIQSGTLIVIALSPDAAGRVEKSKFRDFVDDSPHHYFLMTVGPWVDDNNVTFLGKNGVTRAGSPLTMSAPLGDVANAVDDDNFRSYVVSYCSPGRAGKRDVRLEVTTRDKEGKPSVGSYSTEFDASGFGPGCDPALVPHFVVAKPKEPKALVMNAKPARAAEKPSVKAPAALHGESSDQVSATTPAGVPEPKPSAPPLIVDPPSGLGYE